MSDQDRGRGLGSLLLEHLAALGREHGVSRFEAEVLAENYGMLGCSGAGFAVSRQTQDGEVSVELRTEASAAVIDAADRREWRSEARSLRPLLYPESVAVVGVSRRAAGWVTPSSRDPPAGYAGRLYVVHPEADAVAGLPAHRTLTSIGEPVDLVVIVVPADRVAEVMADACRRRRGGDRGLLGTLRRVRSRGARAAGAGPGAQRPRGRTDSQGVLSWGPGSGSTHVRAGPPGAGRPGGRLPVRRRRVHAARPGPGPRRGRALVRLAAKLDVSSNDLLAAWMDDDQVSAAALHLESFGNAMKFARTARRFAERKPLLAVVGGRAGSTSVGVDALFAQSGVIGCRSATELTETAALLVQQPCPRVPGRRRDQRRGWS